MVVEELLNSNNLPFTVSGRDYLIKCLNSEHEDSNPSLRVDKVSGIAHCFACGWKRNLFKHFNLNPPITSIKLAKLKDKLTTLQRENIGIEFPESPINYKEPFRNISVETLRHFEAFRTESVEKLKDRIVFPIRNLSGKVTGFIARHTMSDSNPKYVNYPEHCVLYPYPVKLDKQYSSIIIVEGIFDMLNMYDNGIHNAICVFGTQTLKNNVYERLLPFKMQGISKVFIAFDGDDAGNSAAAELKPIIESNGFFVDVIELADGTDPGSMSKQELNIIKEYIK